MGRTIIMVEDKIIELPVTLDSATRKKDRSVSLRFTTLFEVNHEDFGIIDNYHQTAGHLLFKANKFESDEVPTDDVSTDLKTPSQRLRAVLYVYHMQTNGDPAKFREFYDSTMEKYIIKVKEQLDDK
jgi:hypothetical protein